MLEHFLRRIDEKGKDPSAAPVLIVALGDSVTQGVMEIDVIDHEHVYHNVLKRMLELRYPQTTFSVINAGVNGAAAGGAIARLDRDVIRHQPDLVIVAFCLNDSAAGRAALPKYRAHIETIVRRVRAETESDVLLLTSNFMASRDNPKVAERHRPLAATIFARQNDGTLKAFVEALREVGHELDAPVADVYAEWERMAAEGADVTARLCNGLNHPDVEGQALIARTLFALIERAAR